LGDQWETVRPETVRRPTTAYGISSASSPAKTSRGSIKRQPAIFKIADSVPATGPLRPFRLDTQAAHERVHVAQPDDRMARSAVLFTDADDLRSWLAGGEALSAVLLTATGENLAVLPISDMVEVLVIRQLMREMISGVGYPVLVLRIGIPAARENPASMGLN
jgi:hypothetical protein